MLPSLMLSIVCLVVFSGLYPLIVWGIAQAAPNKGEGFKIANGSNVYYANVAQKFAGDNYFWPRPSAVDYNASGSGGSNKAPTNAEYLLVVQQRIDSFITHNPDIKRSEIPVEMVTASGSGLDPDITVQGAMIQASRIAKLRRLDIETIKQLITNNSDKPLYGILGPAKVNVLKLNIALDKLKA